MFANVFTTVIVQPIFNLLVFIYAILPGHNFGVAIIIFTVLVRLLMWPLVKKQINQAKAMRELAPELKKIKAAAKGDRQKESQMTMELYKEREINPFASFGILLVQLPILIGLYSGLNRIIKHPHQIVTFSYSFIQHLGWIHALSLNIHKFDDNLLGFVNLTRSAIGPMGIYWFGILLAAAAAIAQFYQSKQLMPQSKDSRGLRQILSEAGKGKTADQSEVNAAVGRSTMYLVPGMVFLFAIRLPLALPLYWLTSSVVAYIQQDRVLREDVEEADASVNKPAESKPRRKLKSKVVAPAAPASAESFTTSGGLKVTRKTLKSSSPQNQSSSKNRKNKRRKRR